MTTPTSMSRDEKVALVESFLSCMASGKVDELPIGPGFTVESPLVPRLRGQAALDYLRATAAGTKAVEVVQHIVEGDYVATLSVNETLHGRLPVFARFQIRAGRIEDARVFYDPRSLAGSGS